MNLPVNDPDRSSQRKQEQQIGIQTRLPVIMVSIYSMVCCDTDAMAPAH